MDNHFCFPPMHPMEIWNQMMWQENPWNNHLPSRVKSSHFKRPSCYVWINPSEEQKVYKKNVCRKFYSGGTCYYGDTCSFLHVEPGSLQDSSIEHNASSSRKNHVHWKTKLCHKWSISGKCPYGDQCNHAHGHAELRNSGQNYGGVNGKFVATAPSNVSSCVTDDIMPQVKLVEPISLPQSSSRIKKALTLEKCKRIYGDWIDD